MCGRARQEDRGWKSRQQENVTSGGESERRRKRNESSSSALSSEIKGNTCVSDSETPAIRVEQMSNMLNT